MDIFNVCASDDNIRGPHHSWSTISDTFHNNELVFPREVGAFMLVDEPALCFPLDLGPATASLEFVTGAVSSATPCAEPLKVAC